MTNVWSSVSLSASRGGRDLHLSLERGGGSAALSEALRAAIRAGRLSTGDELPSTRALAGDLGVARGTVTKAYAQLAAEGYLRLRQGAPATVAADAVATPVTDSTAGSAVPDPGARWNFLPGLPDLSMFPRAAWLSATRRVLGAAPAVSFGYGDCAGEPALRAALARYLSRSRGVLASPERIVVCSGYAQALVALARALAEVGMREMAFEDPSLASFRERVHAAGQRVVGVGVDADGLRVSDVDSPAVVVTPAHQYPLGVTLAPERRAALARWASRDGGLVIEDDYDGEFRFDRKPVGALQALAPERVVYAGTASKTLAPGLRLAWLVLPRTLVSPVRSALEDLGARGRALDQLVLADLLDSGQYDKHVRRCRTTYRRRRDQLLRALPRSLRPLGISAGLHMVLMLPDGVDERAVQATARRHAVAVEILSPHWMDQARRRNGIIVGYATPAQHAFAPAMQALLTALEATQRS